MYRTLRIHRPAEAARTTTVIATTSAPHLRTPHARATGEIARARERSDASGEPEPPAGPQTTPTPSTPPRSPS